jgi:xylulokinase
MLLLGIDIGTSYIKVSLVDTYSQRCIATAQYPETEEEIISLKPGWAEQSAEKWWACVQQAILKANALKLYDPGKINAIGIAYQMHGLVCVDKNYVRYQLAIMLLVPLAKRNAWNIYSIHQETLQQQN